MLSYSCFILNRMLCVFRSGKTLAPLPEDDVKRSANLEEPVSAPQMGDNEKDRASSSLPADGGDMDSNSKFAIRKVVFTSCNAETPRDNAKAVAEPPPFIVPNLAEQQKLKNLLKAKFASGDYIIKNLNSATQIRAKNSLIYATMDQFLTENKLQFYSYTNDGPKYKKFVLYGLNNEDIDEIKLNLTEYGLDPADIKTMRIKNPRYNDQTNYIVYFDAQFKVTLQILNEVKYICSTVVKWAHYRQPTTNCLQCQTCFRYKHSAAKCHMKQICLYCAEPHPADKCPLLERKIACKQAKIPEFLLRCTNCKGHHTAVFKNCPSRLQLIHNNHMKYNSKSTAEPFAVPTNTPKLIPAPLPTHNAWKTAQQFPPLTRGRKNIPVQQPVVAALITRSHTPPSRQSRYRQSNQTPTTTRPPADRFTNRSQIKNKSNQHRQVKATNSTLVQPFPIHNNYNTENSKSNVNNSTNDHNCFNSQEMVVIFQEMLTSIRTCRNKEQQLQALMTLAIKYMPCRE